MMELLTPPSASYKAGNVDSKSSSSPANSRAYPSQPPSPGLSGMGFQVTPRCQCGSQQAKRPLTCCRWCCHHLRGRCLLWGPAPGAPAGAIQGRMAPLSHNSHRGHRPHCPFSRPGSAQSSAHSLSSQHPGHTGCWRL